jgi:hypothetical protein
MLSASIAGDAPMTKMTASALANTQRTVQSYEGFARQYDTLVNERRPPHIEVGGPRRQRL